MQRLMFESSWDKALSAKDRDKIQRVFLHTCESTNENVQFTRLWQAENHKGELLITVLIHNFGKHVLSFQDTKLLYLANEKVMAEHTFSLPSLIIEPEASMPWTFIFPEGSLKGHNLLDGYIELGTIANN